MNQPEPDHLAKIQFILYAMGVGSSERVALQPMSMSTEQTFKAVHAYTNQMVDAADRILLVGDIEVLHAFYESLTPACIQRLRKFAFARHDVGREWISELLERSA